MKQQVPDIAPVVAALDRFIITTLDNGYLEEVQCVSDLINARVTLVSTYQQMTSKERALPIRKVVNQSMLDVQNNPIGTGHTDRANQIIIRLT